MLLKKLKFFVSNEYMYPSFVSLFINPFYFSRKNLLKNLLFFSKELKGNLLDVGCGNKPYKKIFNVNSYVGLEFESQENIIKKNADYYYKNKFPFENNSFDSIISTQVLEHVKNQNEFLYEINRVLKIGGKCLITVPFIYNEHEKPYDFIRYTSFGIKEKLINHGFKVISYNKSTTGLQVLFQLLNEYIYKKINTKNGYLNFILIIIFISPSNIIGNFLHLILPDDEDLFLDNIIFLEKIKDIN